MPTKASLTISKPQEPPSLWKLSRQRNGGQFDEKREALLSTAAALFREHGYSDVSLNVVADVLKITKPTLYYYVGSKDQLLYEIVTRGQEEILSYMQAIDRGPGTGAEKLRSIMLQYASVIISDYGACMLLMRPRKLDPKLRSQLDTRVRTANEIILRALQAGERDGTLYVSEPLITLQVLFGSLNWIGRWYNPTGRIGPDEYLKMHVDMLLNGVLVERDTRLATRAKGSARTRRGPRSGAKT